MLLGAHVPASDPLATADSCGYEVVQLHLSAPRQWRAPVPRRDAAELRASGRVVSAHAPYLVNPASATPEVREKSWRCLQEALDAAATVGVTGGVVVHAGQAGPDGTVDEALDRWLEGIGRLRGEVPLLIENTASGQAAPGRHVKDLVRLVTAVREAASVPVGVCLDTCHAFAGDPAAAEDPAGWVTQLREGVGAIDLLHVNDSALEAGSGRDRHANLADGCMPAATMAAMLRASGAPAAVLETPGTDDERRADLAAVRDLLSGA